MLNRRLASRVMGVVAAVAPAYTLYVVLTRLLSRGGVLSIFNFEWFIGFALIYAAAVLALIVKGVGISAGVYSASVLGVAGYTHIILTFHHVPYAAEKGVSLLLAALAAIGVSTGRRRLALLLAPSLGLVAYMYTSLHVNLNWLTLVGRCPYTVIESAPLGLYMATILVSALVPGHRFSKLAYSWGLLAVYLCVLSEIRCPLLSLAASVAALASLAAAPFMAAPARGTSVGVKRLARYVKASKSVSKSTGDLEIADKGELGDNRCHGLGRGLELRLDLGLVLQLEVEEGYVEKG